MPNKWNQNCCFIVGLRLAKAKLQLRCPICFTLSDEKPRIGEWVDKGGGADFIRNVMKMENSCIRITEGLLDLVVSGFIALNRGRGGRGKGCPQG